MKTYLLAPGPTPVPPEVLLAMAQPMIHHRTPQFSQIFAEAAANLKYVFQTQQDVLILASSGSGAMEASVTNLMKKGEKAIVVNGGKFGERWGKICQAYGIEVVEIKVEWGKAVEPAAVEKALKENQNVGAVFMQASETSTTVKHPVEAIAKLTKDTNTLLVVDGITGVGVFDLPMDKWGIDVLLSGSQKAFMLPPGLAFIALSEKAWKKQKEGDLPKFYFNLATERKNLAKNTTAWTPAVTLIIGLNEVLKIYKKEGLENSFKRQALLGQAVRDAFKAHGFKMVAPDAPSDAATGVYVPEGVDGGGLVKYLRDTMGVTLAGGQDHLKGKIFRVAHLGYFEPFDILTAVAAIEMALVRFGAKIELGKGVAAAQKVLCDYYPAPVAGAGGDDE
jgi:aspartate aminotransferase-like enzyme